MNLPILITGTDTGIGKTVFAAGLTALLRASYWKPIQSGLEEETDSQIVMRLADIPASRILPEVYRLSAPLSPHRSAELDGVKIQSASLTIANCDRPLVIEGAGGLMVPLSRTALFIDVFARWKIPTVLCARTGLGTINHTLLSLEALRTRNIPLLGVAFIGAEMEDTQRTIAEIGKVHILGRLPMLEALQSRSLLAAMHANFDPAQFIG
jgi:dethiobiotin synthetase